MMQGQTYLWNEVICDMNLSNIKTGIIELSAEFLNSLEAGMWEVQ